MADEITTETIETSEEMNEETRNRSSSTDDELDEVEAESNEKLLERQLQSLDYYIINGFRYAFNFLDIKNRGLLVKTQLQVICANVCNVLNLKYIGEDLNGFQSEKKELTFEELVEYINTELLPKVSGEKFDLDKFDRISWTIIEKQRITFELKILEDKDLFTLWRCVNKINIDGSTNIDIEDCAMLLEEFMNAIGTPWTKGPLETFCEDKLELTFWEFAQCLETKYINNTPKSVFSEGLNTLDNKYFLEVLKKGSLVKKGHRIKSMKERWFLLTPQQLAYYESKSYKKKKGIIVINKSSTVESIADNKNIKCRFKLSCGEKTTAYEMEACDQKTKNEWISTIQQCIDLKPGETPLQINMRTRIDERNAKRQKQREAEQQRQEQEELIRKQLEELELIRQARDAAQAQAENEAALLEEERKRREELEALKAEYERLLEDEKQAREAENEVRSKQQQILEEEMLKRQELERIKVEQDQILEEERKAREGLEEVSKEQAKALEEERERLKSLDEARQAAEAEVAAAHEKLEAAEEERKAAAAKVEAAKERTRMMKLPVGLAKPLALEQKGLTTHRGLGAFVDEDFDKTPLYLSGERRPTAVNKREELTGKDRAEILETNLVKPSQGKATFEGAQEEVVTSTEKKIEENNQSDADKNSESTES